MTQLSPPTPSRRAPAFARRARRHRLETFLEMIVVVLLALVMAYLAGAMLSAPRPQTPRIQIGGPRA